eukprot:4765084-Pleurochrysis_carterae.AAC.1
MGTHSRITEHILSIGNVAGCSGSGVAFDALRNKLRRVSLDRAEATDRKRTFKKVDENANGQSQGNTRTARNTGIHARAKGLSSNPNRQQPSIVAAFDVSHSNAIETAVADLFYGDNLLFRLVESPRFKHLINLVRSAPLSSFKLPNRRRLEGA